MDEQLSDADLGDIEARAGSTFWSQWRTLAAAAGADDEPVTIPARELAQLLTDHDVLLAETARARAAVPESTSGGPVRFSGSALLASARYALQPPAKPEPEPEPEPELVAAEAGPDLEAWDRAFTDVMNANLAAAAARQARRPRTGTRLAVSARTSQPLDRVDARDPAAG